jgi:hypothetical protein
MRMFARLCVAAMLCTGSVSANGDSSKLTSGIYTNEEEVYFDTLAKRPAAPWVSIRVDAQASSNRVELIDAFAKPLAEPWALSGMTTDGPERIRFILPDGKVTELHRARPVSCWVAIRKDKPKEDGSEDWYFARDVKLHDQGGRATVGGGDTGAQAVMIRMRNVTWDKSSTNAPVVSLYVHKPENWDKAEAYSWAAPDSARVGINLRWVQTGCAIEGLDKPSSLNINNFKSNEEAKAK